MLNSIYPSTPMVLNWCAARGTLVCCRILVCHEIKQVKSHCSAPIAKSRTERQEVDMPNEAEIGSESEHTSLETVTFPSVVCTGHLCAFLLSYLEG